MKKYMIFGLAAVFSTVLVSGAFGEEKKLDWNNLTEERQKQELIEKEKRTYQEKQNKSQTGELTEQQKRERREKESKVKSSESNNLTEQQKRERREKEAKGKSGSSEAGKKIDGLSITSFEGIDGRLVGKLKSINGDLIVLTVETQDILKGEVTGKDVTIKVTKSQLENSKEGDRIKVRIKQGGVFKVTVQ